MDVPRPLEGQVHVQWRATVKKLNSVAAKARYLEKLCLLGLSESDVPYIEPRSPTFVDHMLL